MSISITLTDNENGLIYKFKGVIKGSEFLNTEELFFSADPYLTKVKYVLFDYSEALDIDYSFNEIGILVNRAKERARSYPRVLCAFLTNQKIIKTLTEVWGRLIENLGWEYEIFSDMTSLELWLSSKLGKDYNGFFISKPFKAKGDDLMNILSVWENLLNILSENYDVSTALILSCQKGSIKIFQKNSNSDENPFQVLQEELLSDFCSCFEYVIKNDKELYISNTNIEKKRKKKTSQKHNLISYFGLPVHYPTGETFGVICLMNKVPIIINEKLKLEMRSVRDIFESQIALKTNNEKMATYLKEIVDTQILLTNESKIDYLTGLYNRKNFFDLSEIEINRNNRKKKDLSFIFCDIDHFKDINDKYGHDAGDAVLKDVAMFIKSNQRQYDIIWRWGGEEFLIMLPETGLIDANRIANEIRLKIDKLKFTYKNTNIHITMSFGVSNIYKNEKTDDFLIRLDKLLYKAKNSGRNIVISN